MSLTDPRWDNLTNADWEAFADAWNSELRGEEKLAPLPKLPWRFDAPPDTAVEYVVPMNFTASPEAQWKFIVAAHRSGDDATYFHLAVGPVEHLLSTHGERFISLVEQMAKDEPLFAKMLKGCYRNQMSDDVWNRLCVARGDVG